MQLDYQVQQDTRFLVDIVGSHYRRLETYVNIRVRNGDSLEASVVQQDIITDLVHSSTDRLMMVAYRDLPWSEHRPAYYNVFLVQDYPSLCNVLPTMSYVNFQFDGLYTVFIQDSAATPLEVVMEKLWSIWLINAVVIVRQELAGGYVAYSYQPYRESMCGAVEPMEIGRYVDGQWDARMDSWFPDQMANFHQCPLRVGAIEVNPYSMFRQEGNRTVYYGLEVYIAKSIASRLNFSMQYFQPTDNIKWGILQATNSTGLVGMIQRREVDFGFGSLGFSLSRHTYLKWTTPSHLTQMIMAIPPRRPYTSLEKLFQPFTIDAWVCIAFGYATFAALTLVLMKCNIGPGREHVPNPLYTLWVLLLGGSSGSFRFDSWRIFIIGFILNTLVIRTLYQAGMFQRLQASAPLASDLNTISAINKAGLNYNMFRSTVQFYKDNPMIPNSRIRVVQNDTKNWDELFSDLSHGRLSGVIPLPLDAIAYYVKRNGKHGVVYIGKNTGFTYNLGMHFPKTTPLLEPFNAWIHKLHASGLTRHWTEEFRDNRYWTNSKENPEPASLRWNQISGGFFLCAVLLLLATVVFFGEVIHFHCRCRSTV